MICPPPAPVAGFFRFDPLSLHPLDTIYTFFVKPDSQKTWFPPAWFEMTPDGHYLFTGEPGGASRGFYVYDMLKQCMDTTVFLGSGVYAAEFRCQDGL